MSNQQVYIAIAIPSFLILIGWMINYQGNRMLADRFEDLRRDVKAETGTLRTIVLSMMHR